MVPNSSGLKTFGRSLYVLLPWVGASIPPLLITVMVARYGVNIPVWDQWAFVELLDKANSGQLEFKDLWEQHKEHRPVLPLAVMLALARATHWDIRYELAANVVVALGVLGILALLIRRTAQLVAPFLTPWLILTASLTTFSLTQWENWLMGWQLQIFMNALAAVVTVWTLARWGTGWLGLALALLAAVAGAFSFATGLILLALIPLGLLIAPQFDPGASHLKRLALAVAVAAGVVMMYLNGFRYPGDHSTFQYDHPTPVLFFFSHPLSYGYYVLAYMGSSLGAWSKPVSASWGAVGIVTFAWGCSWLWRRYPGYRHTLLPWILLGLYGLLSGFMTGIGRAGSAVDQALAPRYVTFSSLFWVSLVVIVAVAIIHLLHDATVSRISGLTVIAVTVCLMTLAGLSYGLSSIYAKTALQTHSSGLLRHGECLSYYQTAPDECLRILFPDAARVRVWARRLETLAVGPFARSRLERPLSWVNGPGS